jgi:acetoin utilization deacetylase AcuC-like enzyme
MADRVDQAQRIASAQMPARFGKDTLCRWLGGGGRRRTALFTAENGLGKVQAVAVAMQLDDCPLAWGDCMLQDKVSRPNGRFALLYEAMRDWARSSGRQGLVAGVRSDDKKDEPRRVDRRLLRTLEEYDARPLEDLRLTARGVNRVDRMLLTWDALDAGTDPPREGLAELARRVVHMGHLKVPKAARQSLLDRIARGPLCPRRARYRKVDRGPVASARGKLAHALPLIHSPRHKELHRPIRGHEERPARVDALLAACGQTGLFRSLDPQRYPMKHILAVHEKSLVEFLRRVCESLTSDTPIYPDAYPVRKPGRKPRHNALAAGYYCIDASTPLRRGAFLAARESVWVALTAADALLAGAPVAYALCRPPGHHAERNVYGGFCYLNNAAVAAEYLRNQGRVSILDIDFHHSNGTQDIFYHRGDVQTLSIHGHPEQAYPFFSGFSDEKGQGEGLGHNRNFPLREGADDGRWLAALGKALWALRKFDPAIVVLSLGFDTLAGDPIGSFRLTPRAMAEAGRRLGRLGRPLLIVQEGGYVLRNLRQGSRAFFTGLAEQL